MMDLIGKTDVTNCSMHEILRINIYGHYLDENKVFDMADYVQIG